MSEQDWRFTEGTQFRERVVRQAILLGFTAECVRMQLTSITSAQDWQYANRWQFTYEGQLRVNYSSEYHAALEYLRLIGFPRDKVGVINHGR